MIEATILNSNWTLRITPYIDIIIDPVMTRKGCQFRFPRSGKKRIRNKWAKREENYRREPFAIWMEKENMFVCHPSISKAIEYDLYKKGLRNCPPILSV